MFRINGIKIPSPMSVSWEDEDVHDENTERNANVKMVGDIIARKKKLSFKWTYISSENKKIIKSELKKGMFFELDYVDDDGDIQFGIFYAGNRKSDMIDYREDRMRSSWEFNVIEQ